MASLIAHLKRIALGAVCGGLALSVATTSLVIGQPAPAQPEQPPEPKIDKAMLRWNFTKGMKLQFTTSADHKSISSVRGTTEGAVLRLVAALTKEPDEEIRKKAEDLLKQGGKEVLEVLNDYVKEASAEERKAVAPIIEHLKANPEAKAKMPDRFVIAERHGMTNCVVDWKVEEAKQGRDGKQSEATVWVKSHNIVVNARERTLPRPKNPDDPNDEGEKESKWREARFEEGMMAMDPATGKMVQMKEPTDPVAAMFFYALSMDYRFTMDFNKKDVTGFKYTNENQETERKQMNLRDPLQIGPSFRRLPGAEVKVGAEWQIKFVYFAGGDGNRVHVCNYRLEKVENRGGRMCAVMPWTETIYSQGPREQGNGTPIGAGTGEFCMDINENVLVAHVNEIFFETQTKLEIPRRDQPNEKRVLDTFFTNVLKLEMRLSQVDYEKEPPR